MNLAFYAPMKSPNHLQPSGDRTIARNLMRALKLAGFDVRIASNLRTWSTSANADKLVQLKTESSSEAWSIINRWGAQHTEENSWRPDLWLTYHLYYKAPDLIGPYVSRALDLPYAVVEGSYSSRRVHGEWVDWLSAARQGLEVADAIFSFTERDEIGLKQICDNRKLLRLSPFLDAQVMPSREDAPVELRSRPIRLVTVAMMRVGAKLASFELLASSLRQLQTSNWHLDIIGDGEARDQVMASLDAFGDQIAFHGLQDQLGVQAYLETGDVFVWPGIDEAFGMAYLEAQAAGLPVAAVDTAGVSEVVKHDVTGLLAAKPDSGLLAQMIQRLIDDDNLRRKLGRQAAELVSIEHSLPAAARQLGPALRGLVSGP